MLLKPKYCQQKNRHREMVKRLSIAPAQVKAGNSSENIVNEIQQIIYFFHRTKEITKKVYKNIIDSIKI